MRLVVGLGNPGKQYMHTRHNIGFRVINQLADNLKIDWSAQKKLHGLLAKSGDTIYLKPDTFMNESGRSVLAALQFYRLTPADLLIVYDDKDLPLGTLRFRTKGSSGGHNGMNSIITLLGTQEFSRLRIGIAPTDPETIMGDTANYVLGKFNKAEEEQLPEIIIQVIEKVTKTPHSWKEGATGEVKYPIT